MGKTLVIYYSAQGHTKRAAELVAKTLNADLFGIELKEPYTEADLDWTNPEARATMQFNGERDLDDLAVSEAPNWAEYENVILGYPIWWGYAAFPMTTFVAQNSFKDKTVHLFCTSHSSGIGDSDIKLRYRTANDCKVWHEAVRFFQDAPEKEITDWVKSLEI